MAHGLRAPGDASIGPATAQREREGLDGQRLQNGKHSQLPSE